ncbi:hypothetical protein Bca101_067283 [Brassica carinata]
MGRYSYSQPSSSEEYDIDITSLLQAEADLYADEAESSQNIIEAVQYPPQSESDDGIPKTCYCGAEAVVATAYTSKDPGRRYFTCENADDGDCHLWKWWDVAVLEELCYNQRQLRELKDEANESGEKLLKVEKTVGELAKKKSGIANGLLVCVLLSVVFLICMVVMLFNWVEEKDNVLTESLVSTDQSIHMDTPPVSQQSSTKERRKWSVKEDRILISAWLNTSKDAVVGNEQKATSFWKRILEYYNSSPQLVGTEDKTHHQLKNDLIENIWNKFGDEN